MIGKVTGKVLDFSIRSRVCRVCQASEAEGKQPKDHECTKNWTGSSKSMEPDMAIEMIRNLKEDGVNVTCVNADNDSATYSKIKVEFPAIEKRDDQNHIKKGISKALYTLAKTHKELKTDVIDYFIRCFMYAICDNRGSAEQIRKALNHIVPHVYGDHSECETLPWCRYKDNPDTFR